MKHSVTVEQLRSDNNACLNVIGDESFVGVWAYPFDEGGQFVRIARGKGGHLALLVFGSEEAMVEFFETSVTWHVVETPELVWLNEPA